MVVTGNMFGDILSDEASMLTGSIGMLPLGQPEQQQPGPVRTQPRQRPTSQAGAWPTPGHHPERRDDAALQPEQEPPPSASKPPCKRCWPKGLRTPDIYSEGTTKVGTAQMGDAVVKALA